MARPVIIEGPDGAGKSTLGQRLAHDLGWPYTHTGGSCKNAGEIVSKMADLARQSRPRIFDRCPHISDDVYKRALGFNPIFNRCTAWSRLEEMEPVIIFCRLRSSRAMLDQIASTEKAHKPPGYLAQVRQNHQAIISGYDEAMKNLKQIGFQILTYDWQDNDYETLKDTVKICAG